MDPYPPPSSMTLSPQSPNPNPIHVNSNTNSSSIFRPRRSDDWNDFREIIEQLYRNDQLKLRDVKRIMERDYKFQASEKQYKDRLAAWHVRKNIKAKEVHLMIRKQQKRAAQGKQTAFRVNGQEVDNKRIARFQRRYGDTWDEEKDKDAQQTSPEPDTPSDMTCYTPEPADEAATPVSPPELQSPSRETPYPLSYDPHHIDTIPDLAMDDDSPFSLSMHHNSSRRAYPREPAPLLHHPAHPHAQQQHPTHAHLPHAHHPHPHLPHPQHTMLPVTAGPIPPIQSMPPAVPVQPLAAPAPGSSHRDYMSSILPPSANMVTYSNEWDRVESFQTQLASLGTHLNKTMSPWNREHDPNETLHHPVQNSHEGTGL